MGALKRTADMAMLSITLVVAATGVAVGARIAPSGAPTTARVLQQGPPANVDPYANPILTAADAISRTLDLLPADVVPTASTARLVSRMSLAQQWFRELDGNGLPRVDWMTAGPMWLVGVNAGGLTVDDTIIIPGGDKAGDQSSVDGAFMLWDANSGRLKSSGALLASSFNTYGNLEALSDELLPISQATEVP